MKELLFPLVKHLEIGTYKVKELGILKVINEKDWVYFDPTGTLPPNELFQLKRFIYSTKFIGDSASYLTDFDEYMDILHKPVEEQWDDFIRIISEPVPVPPV